MTSTQDPPSREDDQLLNTSINGGGNETQLKTVVIVASDDDNTDSAPSDNENNEGSVKQKAQKDTKYTSLGPHKKKRNRVIILCTIIWLLIATALTVYLLYYFGVLFPDKTVTTTMISTTGAPYKAKTTTTTTTVPPITTYISPIESTNILSTSEPITMILYEGNEITEQGITINFPPKAFPDSELMITISDASETMKSLFYDTTSVFQTMSIDNITNNVIHFEVEHMPLSTPNITYKTIIPITSDLLQKCPNDYGYEIFSIVQQNEFPHTTYSAFVLFESKYDPTAQTLTTSLFPEIFSNFEADIVLSCAPGTNIVPTRRRLQNPNYALDCRASELICPIKGGRCITVTEFGRDHTAVDYVTEHKPIVAAHNGVVERNDISMTYGQLIVIRGEDGSATLYGNLDEITVDKGQEVERGEVIAIPKRSAPAHLHFEYVPNGRIYATKKRINPSDCFPPILPETDITTTADSEPEPEPPLVTDVETTTTLYLPQGSITLRDSGRLADDSFAGYIDGYKVCETTIGQLNTCAINFLRPGLHTLTIEVLVADDGWGTFNVQLFDDWLFTDGSTTKDQIQDIYYQTGEKSPPEWKGSWNFTVPIPP